MVIDSLGFIGMISAKSLTYESVLQWDLLPSSVTWHLRVCPSEQYFLCIGSHWKGALHIVLWYLCHGVKS